ncbi:hypothetical protein A2U01_0106051, partial [Trifolium medium]|nr:hypothetical protein [Trifolium medium]
MLVVCARGEADLTEDGASRGLAPAVDVGGGDLSS